jgi:3-oxoacyl-[acyl-carrier protein] reductase
MSRFLNQNVIVTGGTRGIGAGITSAFLKEGAYVYAIYAKNDEAAMNFKNELKEAGEKLKLVKLDVSNFKDCESFFKSLENTKVDILINNSGIRQDQLIAAMDEKTWDDVLGINLKGTFQMTKFAVLNMMKQRYGRIVNISSIGGKLGLPGQANYAASKAGQIALSLSVSKEVGKRNITINNVCPGFIDTDLLKDLPSEQIKMYENQVPLKRFGKVEEVASAVLFLASKEASYITGSTLDVAGGLNG